MHILTIPSRIDSPIPVQGGRDLQPGHRYLCTNSFVGEMMQTSWRVVMEDGMYALRLLITAVPYDESVWNPFNPELSWNGRHIWLIRGGGYGDLLMMTPLIKELRRRWPSCIIHVACGSNMHGIFDESLGVIEELLPVDMDSLEYSGTISFEDIIEGTPQAETIHIAQLFASKLGITLEDLKPVYSVKESEKEWVISSFPRNPKLPRVGIQFVASALYRSYPKMQTVMMELAKHAEVFLFGAPGQIKFTAEVPNVTNLMEQEKKITFRQSAAILETCDSCIAPDSSLVHLSSALDVPCVALYGPFPSSLRVTSPKVTVLEGKAPCSPCFFHAHSFDQFPHGMPCTEVGKCVALDQIDAGYVVREALNLAGVAHPLITL